MAEKSKKQFNEHIRTVRLGAGNSIQETIKIARKTTVEDIQKAYPQFKDHKFLRLRQKLFFRPKDSRLQPWFVKGKIPGRTKEEKLKFIHETKDMTVEQKIEWLQEHKYPTHGRQKAAV